MCLFACERVNATHEGVQLLGELEQSGRRVRTPLGMAASVRVLERAGKGRQAYLMLSQWLNDYVNHQIKAPPGSVQIRVAVLVGGGMQRPPIDS